MADKNASMLELYARSYASMAKMGDGKVNASDVAYDIRNNMIRQLIPAGELDRQALTDALFPAYLGIQVLTTMCRKAGLEAGVEASKNAMAKMAEICPELPALSATRPMPSDRKAGAA